MKAKYLFFLYVTVLVFSGTVYSQKNKGKKAEKFNQKLICPFENGTGREPKEAFTWDPPDQKVIMISHLDTVVRSCIDARVLTVNPTEDGRFEIVIYYGEYYFWYYGVKKSLVNVNQYIKAGQPMATYTLGKEMEFRMFLDEEPMDPREFLLCKPMQVPEEMKNKK